jgi:hypothetical protein
MGGVPTQAGYALRHFGSTGTEARSDMLFLTMVDAKRRLIVLTEPDMYEQCKREAAGGRVPPEIGFVCAVIPSADFALFEVCGFSSRNYEKPQSF